MDYSAGKGYYKNAVQYMQENYMQNINIAEVAQALGISYVYLNKLFKAHQVMGIRPIDYLNLLRIDQAACFLIQTDDSLEVISEKVGYNNIQSFARFF